MHDCSSTMPLKKDAFQLERTSQELINWKIPDRQKGQAIFWTSCNQLTGKTKMEQTSNFLRVWHALPCPHLLQTTCLWLWALQRSLLTSSSKLSCSHPFLVNYHLPRMDCSKKSSPEQKIQICMHSCSLTNMRCPEQTT